MPIEHDIGDSGPKYNTENFGITKKQRACLMFLRDFQDRHGLSPSYQEIAEHMGLRSKSGVHRIIHALRARGHIKTLDHRARAISVISDSVTVADAISRVLSACALSTHTEAELRALLAGEGQSL